MPDTPQARIFIVSGMVQGVGYRFFAERVAARLGVTGYVKNRSDGCVEVYAIGTLEQLRAMRGELARGPRMASVSAVHEEEAEVDSRYASDFSIEHGW